MFERLYQVRSPRQHLLRFIDGRLSNRIEAKLGDSSASGGRLIVEDRLTVDGSIPLPSDPMEELWALQAALGKVGTRAVNLMIH